MHESSHRGAMESTKIVSFSKEFSNFVTDNNWGREGNESQERVHQSDSAMTLAVL